MIFTATTRNSRVSTRRPVQRVNHCEIYRKVQGHYKYYTLNWSSVSFNHHNNHAPSEIQPLQPSCPYGQLNMLVVGTES